MSNGVDIDFKFPDWAATVELHRDELNLFTAAMVQTNRGLLFDKEGAHNGRSRWAPLKLRAGQILSKRGKLRKSIAPSGLNGTPGPDGIVRFGSDVITIGTTLLYARMMNDGTTKMPGGVLRPVNAKALKIPLPSGQSATGYTRKMRSAPVEKQRRKAEADVSRARQRWAQAMNPKSGKINPATIGRHRRAWEVKQERVAMLAEKIKRIHITGKGGANFIFRKWVRIPARPFDDWNQQDQDELDTSLAHKLYEVMNRG